MATALTENGGDGSLPDTAEEVEAVIAAVQTQVSNFAGHAVSQSDAQAHLQQTHASVTKSLLAGKTFYVVDEADDGSKQVTKLVFNQDVTAIEATSPNKTENWGISIEGNKLVFSDDTDGSYTIISQANGYIYFDDRYANGSKDGDGHRLYANKADAEAYLATLNGGSTAAAGGSLSDLIVGKTLYENCNGDINSITFGTDGHISWIEDGQKETETYRIDGNTIYINDGDGEEAHPLLESTDTYVKLGDEDGDTRTFYFSEADAQNAPADECGDGDNTLQNSFSTTYLDGRTLYFVQYDDFGYDGEGEPGLRWNMARMAFTANTIAWTEYDTPDSGTHTFNYSVTNDGKILIDEAHSDLIELKNQTNDYLKVCEGSDCNTYLFFDEAKARAFRDSHNSSSSASHYMLQESDIAGHSILVGDPSKDKAYAADHTYTSLESDVNQRDTGTWSIEDGKLKHVWSNGSVEIHSFSQKPATGVTLTNETYGASAQITEYK